MSEYIYKPPPPPPPPAPAPATDFSNRGRGRGGGHRGAGRSNNNGQRGRGRGFNARGGGGGGGGRWGYRDSSVFPQAHYSSSFPQSPNQYGPQQQQQFPMNPFYHLQTTPPLPAPYQWPQQHQQPQQQQQQTSSYLSYSQEKTAPAPTLTSTSYKTAQSGWPVTPSYAHFTLPTPRSSAPPPPALRARKDEKPDMDEETWLRLNGGKLLGTNLKPPETPEEIEQWIRERKRKFPTRERVAARVKEVEERKRKLAEASNAGAKTPTQQKRKRTEKDPDNGHPLDPPSDPDADTDSQSSSPEELPTSKKPPPRSTSSLITSPPPRKKSMKQAALCRVFKATGRCESGEGCRYRHVPPEGKQKKGREKKEVKSLYQRLLDQDREKENEIVVRAVRYLFEKGALTCETEGGK